MASMMRPSLLRQAVRSPAAFAMRTAALHTTSKRCAILPPGPRKIHILLQNVFGVARALRAELLWRTTLLTADVNIERIIGGVNDPAPVPTPSPAHGSFHWSFERIIAAGLVPLSIAPFVSGSVNPTLDAFLCSAMLIHSHMGFQAVVIDYIPKRTYPGLRKLFWWGLNAATLTVGIGLYEFETNDVGVTEAIKRVWKA
ncbi:hypothetical protein E4U32_007547 [Claviceps aff. humidiphila group G2b]|nr:hypothetical protein E4U32_007547 [Claviceps aff. humidiphila group G2b]